MSLSQTLHSLTRDVFYVGNPFETRSRARSLAATRRGFTFYFEIPVSSIPRLNQWAAAKSTAAACRWNDAVHTQILDHLTVVIEAMSCGKRCQE